MSIDTNNVELSGGYLVYKYDIIPFVVEWFQQLIDMWRPGPQTTTTTTTTTAAVITTPSTSISAQTFEYDDCVPSNIKTFTIINALNALNNGTG